MANYVLIHGGDKGEGTFWWKDVAQLLSFNNHNVLYPSMKPLLENATLQDNIDEVCELIQSKNLDNIILAGHSYGGMVITGVADRLHTKIGCLVYIDSVVPKNGKSLYGLLAETGFDYKSFGFPPHEACLAALSFSEEVIKKIPKVYIHCRQGELINATNSIYKNEVVNKAEADNWNYVILDTTHYCLHTQPKEVAIILNGAQLLLSLKDST